MKNKDLRDVRERAMKMISERASEGEEPASPEALQQGGSWRVVGTEEGLCTGHSLGQGERERRGVREVSRGQIA